MSKQWHPNHLIKKIAGFQPYNNLHELVHQATKEECQVQDDINSQAKPTMAPYTRATPSIGAPSSCKAPTTSSSRPPTSSSKPGTTPSASAPRDSTDKTSQIECFTCKGRG